MLSTNIIQDSLFNFPQDTFNQNWGTTFWSDANKGWLRPFNHKWVKDSAKEYAYADNSGAGGLTQVIKSDFVSTGLQTINFDATNLGGRNTLRLQVYGINGQFKLGNWDTKDPISANSNSIEYKTLLDTGNVATEEFDWKTFSQDVDFGNGYEYVVIRFVTDGVETNEFMAIDNVSITQKKEIEITSIIDSQFDLSVNDFNTNWGTTFASNADKGWFISGGDKSKWNRDKANEYAYADNSGAGGLTQVIKNDYITQGSQFISFDGINRGVGNTLRLQVYGVNGNFKFSNWDTKDPVSNSLEPIAVKTLLDTGNVATAEFNWTNFSNEVDFGSGYEYIAVRFTTNGVESNEFMAIDNFTIANDLSAIPANDNNNFPEANNDIASTTRNNSIKIDVLSNDSDPEGDIFSLDSFTQPVNGSIALNQDGSFTYTPVNNLTGQDSFTYTIVDEHGGKDTATVNITVKTPSFEIGSNLNGISYWSTQLPFIDAFQTADQWITTKKGVWSTNERDKLDLDENGWVRSLPTAEDNVNFTHVQTLFFRGQNGNYPSGEYVVLYDGEGTINYGFDAKFVSSSQGRDVINITPSDRGVLLSITETDPNQTGDYIRNIRVVPKADENTYQTEVFNPDWLNKIEPFGAFRFMDWMQTNDSTQQEWSDRPSLEDATWHKIGAPVEIMVDLVNHLDSDPWFNMPHMVSDDYVRQFATYVRDNLDPELKIYVEYSNEAWNPQFQQWHWINEQAQTEGMRQVDWYSRRTTQVMQIWDEVFAQTGDKERVIGVMAGQAANPWILEQAINYKWSSENKSHKDYGIDVLSIAGYVGLGKDVTQDQLLTWTQESDGGFDRLFNRINNTDLPKTYSDWQKALDTAKAEGLSLVAYEGGQHLAASTAVTSFTDEVINNLMIEANRDPRMGEIYEQLMTQWRNMGGDLFMHFNDVSPSSKYGSWGLLESTYQDSSPKYDTIMNLINTPTN
ncbi:cadherin-like domain-containing protein [Cyanobacterium aponinum AL20118]|uniref:Cadherin-like domain-containing protein n=1 Tax=Cyanobacterium aponinum AL20115 TaxID=3090662 RepID=A0AAF1C6K9_9CHRO|nr:cadherin-like domain-containing protein [Cyanobacterium aponinum]WPF89304.1 cadherin-like domain-containing protein [Cyanobacterium aponinum AL20115]